MKELTDNQLKEIQEACLSSYQRGYREGFTDACKQLRGMAEKLAEATEEVLHDKRKYFDTARDRIYAEK